MPTITKSIRVDSTQANQDNFLFINVPSPIFINSISMSSEHALFVFIKSIYESGSGTTYTDTDTVPAKFFTIGGDFPVKTPVKRKRHNDDVIVVVYRTKSTQPNTSNFLITIEYEVIY